ncbi:MAG TPA: hypothetical protein VK426_11110 [Methanobacterium sp.]|nr:hypothetical protein [Methanobacterium sp.]
MTWDEQFVTPDGRSEPTGNERYVEIQNVPTAWIVQVNDNLKKVGNIYIDSESGEILKVVINGKVLENVMGEGDQVNGTEINNTIDTTDQIPQNIIYIGILAVVSILIIASAGYWFKIKK